jgi:predicted pyridoxine 5'-phosphate oxidase superfamily flavin-nucleotide-binding protein
MTRQYPAIAFTDSVKAAQDHYGSRDQNEKLASSNFDDRRLTEREAEFIAERDSFYVASVNEEGWPYVQFRGGPQGFLKVLDEGTLAYADFRGNLQYITVGNVAHEKRVSLILMDYAGRRRLKIMARAEVFDAADHPELIAEVEDPDYRARVERAVVLHVEAFDWNCPQHITPRFTEEEFQQQLTSTVHSR